MAVRNVPFFRKLRGFTFAEILVAILIMAIVAGSVLMLGYTYIKHFEQANEITIAKDRATMVLSYLEKRILHTGLGMPVSADEFADSFEGLWVHQDFQGERWQGSVHQPEPPGTLEQYNESEELLVAYAVPTSIFSISSGDVNNNDLNPTTIEVSDLDEEKLVEDLTGQTTNGWVVFPSAKWPFKARKTSGYSSDPKTITLSVNGQKNRSIFENDNLHYVRFMEVKAEGGSFKARDLARLNMKSGLQPIVEGVLDCRFRLDRNGVLTV
ncbi:MAG: type II secretion system protein, partial [Thermovirga sp.]|nr:type II secretion system protein [Thermovirga sp.]